MGPLKQLLLHSCPFTRNFLFRSGTSRASYGSGRKKKWVALLYVGMERRFSIARRLPRTAVCWQLIPPRQERPPPCHVSSPAPRLLPEPEASSERLIAGKECVGASLRSSGTRSCAWKKSCVVDESNSASASPGWGRSWISCPTGSAPPGPLHTAQVGCLCHHELFKQDEELKNKEGKWAEGRIRLQKHRKSRWFTAGAAFQHEAGH